MRWSAEFWDTAGQERFNNMHPSYYFGAHVCVLCFDCTRKSTYKNLSAWFKVLAMGVLLYIASAVLITVCRNWRSTERASQ